MKPTPPPILSRSRRTLLDLILYIIAFILAVLFLVPDAESAEIWWKKPGEKYWQECVVISTSVGPVYRYIPDGAVIAVRDGGVRRGGAGRMVEGGQIGVAGAKATMKENQECGKDWEFRVIAVNKAGEGQARQHRHGSTVDREYWILQ